MLVQNNLHGLPIKHGNLAILYSQSSTQIYILMISMSFNENLINMSHYEVLPFPAWSQPLVCISLWLVCNSYIAVSHHTAYICIFTDYIYIYIWCITHQIVMRLMSEGDRERERCTFWWYGCHPLSTLGLSSNQATVVSGFGVAWDAGQAALQARLRQSGLVEWEMWLVNPNTVMNTRMMSTQEELPSQCNYWNRRVPFRIEIIAHLGTSPYL
jgi:hypothetical protein